MKSIKAISLLTFMLGVSGCSGFKKDLAPTSSSSAYDGATSMLNLQNTQRFFSKALLGNPATMGTSLTLVNPSAAQILPTTNDPNSAQSPSGVLAIQQIAIAACTDMVNSEKNLLAASRKFLKVVDFAQTPDKVSVTAISQYIDALSMALWAKPVASDSERSALTDLHNSISASIMSGTSLMKNASGTAISGQERLIADLVYVCSAAALAPRAVTY